MADKPSEFDLISEYFSPLASGHPGSLGLRDDAAVLAPSGREQVITMDALVGGVHFFPDDPPRSVAIKVLGVNLSDLAAMGARPDAYTLAAALPADISRDWIAEFTGGLAWMQARHGVQLIGGDTVATPGLLSFAITAFGSVEPGRALRRGNAKAGDVLFVSGALGDAALGLGLLSGELSADISPDARRHLIRRYHEPEPRTKLGPGLIGLANSAIDISDGLIADVGHLAAQSGQRFSVDISRVPLSAAARELVDADPELTARICGGGDDYELAFTAPAAKVAEVENLTEQYGIPLSRIGSVRAPADEGAGVDLIGENGSVVNLAAGGFRHF